MTPKEAKKFIGALRSPLIRQFIDTSKLLMSPQFDAAADFAVAHRLASGDSTFIQALLDVFSTSSSYSALLHWFCDRAALSFSVGQSRVRLRLTESPRRSSANLVDYLSIHKGTKQGLITPTAEEGPVAIQKPAKKFGHEEGRRGGSPFLQGGAPGLGKR